MRMRLLACQSFLNIVAHFKKRVSSIFSISLQCSIKEFQGNNKLMSTWPSFGGFSTQIFDSDFFLFWTWWSRRFLKWLITVLLVIRLFSGWLLISTLTQVSYHTKIVFTTKWGRQMHQFIITLESLYLLTCKNGVCQNDSSIINMVFE